MNLEHLEGKRIYALNSGTWQVEETTIKKVIENVLFVDKRLLFFGGNNRIPFSDIVALRKEDAVEKFLVERTEKRKIHELEIRAIDREIELAKEVKV